MNIIGGGRGGEAERAPALLNSAFTVKMERKLDYIRPPTLQYKNLMCGMYVQNPGKLEITRINSVGFDPRYVENVLNLCTRLQTMASLNPFPSPPRHASRNMSVLSISRPKSQYQ